MTKKRQKKRQKKTLRIHDTINRVEGNTKKNNNNRTNNNHNNTNMSSLTGQNNNKSSHVQYREGATNGLYNRRILEFDSFCFGNSSQASVKLQQMHSLPSNSSYLRL